METEFKRLLAGPRRELGIGMVCHLGTGGVADALSKVAKLQSLNVDVRERRIHLLVCGGDGTVTWVLSEIEAFMQAPVNCSDTRLNISWMAVELPRKQQAILRPLGGMSQTVDLMLLGIHSTK